MLEAFYCCIAAKIGEHPWAALEFLDYRDSEWGHPVADDIRLFEQIRFEGFQSASSWRTILANRDNFRAVFSGLDFYIDSDCDMSDAERLLVDMGIVRRRCKIGLIDDRAPGYVMRAVAAARRKDFALPKGR